MPTDTSVSKGQYFVPLDNTTEQTRLNLVGISKAYVVSGTTTFFATGSNALVKAISFSPSANATASLWNGGDVLSSDFVAGQRYDMHVYKVVSTGGRTILYY
jgi:hypothetical protein